MKRGTYRRTEKHRKLQSLKHVGQIVSEETRNKIIKNHVGTLGKKFSKKTKQKMSDSHKNQKLSEETKKKIGIKGKGRKRSKESIEKTRLYNLGKKLPQISGKNHWNWKGGITPENIKIRNSIQTDIWRNAVYARDGYIDQKTGIKGPRLVAHHILNFSEYPELRFAIDNGITLSRESHVEFHRKYGQKHNTKEQLEEFLCRKI